MNDGPFVSVLMTAYNREKYIAEAIESVLASTYTDFELLIIDDCSKDNTVSIAKNFEIKDKRIRVYTNEKNLGQFPNRNHASGYAKGEFMFWVDSDDTILPGSISDLITAMQKFPEASFGMFAPEREKVCLIQSKPGIREHFFKRPFLNHGPGGTIIKRDFFNKLGKYPVEYGIPGDMFFNLKACCEGPVVLLPFVFMNYRRHEGQEINDSYDYLYNNYKYMRDALDQLPLGLEKKETDWLRKKNKRRFAVNISKYFLSTLNIKKTANAIKRAGFSFRDALEGVFH